jgi:hypothetical protein
MRVCGTVSQICNLQADRIYLHRLASPIGLQADRIYLHRLVIPIGLQDAILRYSRLKICATFRFGPPKEYLRNPGIRGRDPPWFWLRQVRNFEFEYFLRFYRRLLEGLRLRARVEMEE